MPVGPDANSSKEATPHEFDHPWFQTVIMFIGMTACTAYLLHLPLVGILTQRI